jgi:hypothetical protein
VPLFPPHSPPVGLSLWISKDKNLSNWELYDFGACLGTLGDDTAVICPEIVPNETRAGYIGDNYVWKETTADGAVIFYVLSGSNKCPEGMWCGYGAKNSTAQGLLFRSTDLTEWEFVNVVWENPKAQRLDTPDIFTLPGTSSTVLLWLSSEGTRWEIGNTDPTSREFTSSSEGHEDLGNLICQQSLTTPQEERVSIGWIGLDIPGAPFTGAQSLPRMIKPTADGKSLRFEPLPALWTLHEQGLAQASMAETTVVGGASKDVSTLLSGFSTRMHFRATVSIPAPDAIPAGTVATATVSVLGGGAKTHAKTHATNQGTNTNSATGDNKVDADGNGLVISIATTGKQTPAPGPPAPTPSRKQVCLAAEYLENADTTGTVRRCSQCSQCL